MIMEIEHGDAQFFSGYSAGFSESGGYGGMGDLVNEEEPLNESLYQQIKNEQKAIYQRMREMGMKKPASKVPYQRATAVKQLKQDVNMNLAMAQGRVTVRNPLQRPVAGGTRGSLLSPNSNPSDTWLGL